MILKWPQWTGKPSRPVEPDGKAHNCPKYSGGGDYKSKYDVDIWTKYEPEPSFYFCGRCKTLCVTDKNTWYWCSNCEMYPAITHRGSDELDCDFNVDTNIKSLQTTNRIDLMEEYRRKNTDAPANWMHMNDDGTIKNGYKLTPDLTKWYEKDGKVIIINMYSKIYYKNKERVTV